MKKCFVFIAILGAVLNISAAGMVFAKDTVILKGARQRKYEKKELIKEIKEFIKERDWRSAKIFLSFLKESCGSNDPDYRHYSVVINTMAKNEERKTKCTSSYFTSGLEEALVENLSFANLTML